MASRLQNAMDRIGTLERSVAALEARNAEARKLLELAHTAMLAIDRERTTYLRALATATRLLASGQNEQALDAITRAIGGDAGEVGR